MKTPHRISAPAAATASVSALLLALGIAASPWSLTTLRAATPGGNSATAAATVTTAETHASQTHEADTLSDVPHPAQTPLGAETDTNTAPPADFDPDLPQPLDFSFAEDVLQHSPFTRSVNLEDSLQLTAIAYINGRPVATILNTATQERHLVSEEPNALGWRLTGLSAGTDLAHTEIHMTVGPETLHMQYGSQQLHPGTGNGPGGTSSRIAFSGSSKKSPSGKTSAASLLSTRGREIYSSLSTEGRSKFKDMVKTQRSKNPGMTPEQSSAYAQKALARVKETDRPGSSASSSNTAPKAKVKTKRKGA